MRIQSYNVDRSVGNFYKVNKYFSNALFYTRVQTDARSAEDL